MSGQHLKKGGDRLHQHGDPDDLQLTDDFLVRYRPLTNFKSVGPMMATSLASNPTLDASRTAFHPAAAAASQRTFGDSLIIFAGLQQLDIANQASIIIISGLRSTSVTPTL